MAAGLSTKLLLKATHRPSGHCWTLPLLAKDLAKKKDNNGRTALHEAAFKGHTKAIRTLLNFDPSLVKNKDDNGGTALHEAAFKGHTEAIRTLLDFTPYLAKDLAKEEDEDGFTALDKAAEKGHTEAIQTLQPLTAPRPKLRIRIAKRRQFG
ncbi:ankyrin repeat domain-containing protein [Endozoicomonas sp. GU-1]|uniref:ankyrin repeat domain-containing protein n=1 Tax=Endozoicomonas sp. GU-1 TaxID=3009078 RepID=UPI0022B4018B|nr:ankyrin repeat domain-containing protein [Endozoicomonas sp. GU-1]WBA86407.1 ankyrin repeat domain-containing protein [Endozoicomonas sp. GU-1]